MRVLPLQIHLHHAPYYKIIQSCATIALKWVGCLTCGNIGGYIIMRAYETHEYTRHHYDRSFIRFHCIASNLRNSLLNVPVSASSIRQEHCYEVGLRGFFLLFSLIILNVIDKIMIAHIDYLRHKLRCVVVFLDKFVSVYTLYLTYYPF